MNLMKLILTFLLIAFGITFLVWVANAQTLERNAFLSADRNALEISRASGYRNQAVIATASQGVTVTVPASVAVSSTTGAGRVDFWADNAKFAVCPFTGVENNCGSTIPLTTVTDGTAWIWSPTSIALMGLDGAAITGFMVSSPVSDTIISADFFK